MRLVRSFYIHNYTSDSIMDFVLLPKIMCVLMLVSVCVKAAVLGSHDVEYPSGSIPCKLFDISQLDCSQRWLRVIPTLPVNITSVDLSQNAIMNLSESSFRGQILLTYVDLHENELFSIYDSPFKWLVQLRVLDLSNTVLERLAATVFYGLHNLKYLSLRTNLLTSLPDGVFEGLENLHILNLQKNSLAEIPSIGTRTIDISSDIKLIPKLLYNRHILEKASRT